MLQMQISRLDQDVRWSRALDGNEYMPGLLGLNNMKHNDYVNVLVQIFSRVAPVRNVFLQPSNFNDSMSSLTIQFGELLRKMWNPRNFKGQVSKFLNHASHAHGVAIAFTRFAVVKHHVCGSTIFTDMHLDYLKMKYLRSLLPMMSYILNIRVSYRSARMSSCK